jgi:hypothetical protein
MKPNWKIFSPPFRAEPIICTGGCTIFIHCSRMTKYRPLTEFAFAMLYDGPREVRLSAACDVASFGLSESQRR